MITTFDEYQLAANRTISGTSASTEELIIRLREIPNASLLLTAGLGLAGEGGEFADHVKKILFHNQALTPERRAKMEKELGDIFWYANCGAKALDKNLVFIADGNIVKLTDRHPQGFDPAYHSQYAQCGNSECRHSRRDHSVDNGDYECNVAGCQCSKYIDHN